MITIWKFPIDVRDEVECFMPMGAEILTVYQQGGQPCMWALVDTEAQKVTRRFKWRGSGNEAGGLGRYVGTVHMERLALVFHLFEADKETP